MKSKMLLIKALLMGAILLGGVGASAEPLKFQIDRSHANFGFDVHHFGYSRTVGRFNDFAGNLLIDEAQPAKSTIEVTVKTTSIDTNHKMRDDHLRSADFFNVEKYPTMTFKSVGITMMDEKRGKVAGDFTMLGVTKPVTLDFILTRDLPNPNPVNLSIRTLGFQAEGKIKRSDYGMTLYVGDPIGDEVNVSLYFDAIRCVGAAAKAPGCLY